MADRVSASITIGGGLPCALLPELVEFIQSEGLSTEWDGDEFDAAQIVKGEPLMLMAHEVAWGRFEGLEAFCVENHLVFARWSGSCPGSFGAERVVFDGAGGLISYEATDDDVVVISRPTIDRLGSIKAIRTYLDRADSAVPPLLLVGASGAA